MHKAQMRYKRDFDRRLRLRRKVLISGGYAFLRVENKSEKRHLGLCEEVSIDRVEPAPAQYGDAPDAQLLRENAFERISNTELETPDLYEVERIIRHGQDPIGPEGQLLYQDKWYGYTEHT
eukprot:IDg13011t1